MKRFTAIVLLLSCLVFAASCQSAQAPPSGSTSEDSQSDPPSSTGNGTGDPDDSDASGDPEEPDLPEEPTTYPLNSNTEGVRILGVRNLASGTQINCDWSCSGIELTVDCKGGDIRFQVSTRENKPAYFRVWLDGEVWEQSSGEVYYRVGGSSEIIMREVPAGTHTVRLLKVTGYTLAQAQILSVQLNGSILPEAPAEKELYIEFVGDSITCGWGTIGGHAGAYTDQDGTLAYPYLLAEALEADYSMTALSGQGLCYGNPGLTDGYLYDSPYRNSQTESEFGRKADLVVINIGTNDYSHRSELDLTGEEYRQVYLEFLQTVREKNGDDCKILCLYNAMNDTFASSIVEACSDMGGAAAGVFSQSLPRAQNNAHPNIDEHAAYAELLLPLVEQILSYEGSPLELVESGDGDLDFFDFAQAKEQ